MPVVRRVAKVGSDERGVTAIIVAIMIIVLFGAAALAFDVGLMYEERRELQRTADVAAVSGAMQLKSGTDAAFATAEFYVNENPSTEHPAYDPTSGDTITASNFCEIAGFSSLLPCVRVNVITPEFPLTFARVLGNTDTPIAAQATAVYASASPTGLRLVPWIVLDCPDTAGRSKTPDGTWLYPDEIGVPATTVMEEPWASNCINGHYVFKTEWPANGGTSLFMPEGGPSRGNFQGGNLAPEGDCPPYPDGYFNPGGGANDYRNFIARRDFSCTVARGARVHPKTGANQGPTSQGVSARIAASGCTDPLVFDATIDPTPDLNDGQAAVVNDWENPCLMAIMYVVHSDPADQPNGIVDDENYQGNSITALQDLIHPDVNQRFKPLGQVSGGGASDAFVVRRFSLFYLTANPTDNGEPWKGIFLKSDDSLGSEIADMPCLETDGICKVQQIYEGY